MHLHPTTMAWNSLGVEDSYIRLHLALLPRRGLGQKFCCESVR
jgi:hypothetical protein